MDASKKNFCAKIYPLDLSMSKVWFICFSLKVNGVINNKRVLIPQKLDKNGRLQWANDCIEKYKSKKNSEWKVVKASNTCFNPTIILLYAALARKTRLSDKTVSTFKGHIKGLNLYCQKFNIENIDSKTARDFIFYLQTTEELEARTINHYIQTINYFFEDLIKHQHIKINPFKDIERLPTKRAFSEHYTDREIKLIFEGIKKHKPFLLLPVLTILHCATRNGQEMPNIQIKDIDFLERKLWINDTYSKNREKEPVFIPDSLMQYFDEHNIKSYPKNYYLFSKTGKPSAEKVGQNFFQNHFKEVLKLIGIYKNGKGFYRLKNTLAVKMVKQNVNKFAIQKQFRHKRFDTTEKYLASLQIDEFPELRGFSFF